MTNSKSVSSQQKKLDEILITQGKKPIFPDFYANTLEELQQKSQDRKAEASSLPKLVPAIQQLATMFDPRADAKKTMTSMGDDKTDMTHITGSIQKGRNNYFIIASIPTKLIGIQVKMGSQSETILDRMKNFIGFEPGMGRAGTYIQTSGSSDSPGATQTAMQNQFRTVLISKKTSKKSGREILGLADTVVGGISELGLTIESYAALVSKITVRSWLIKADNPRPYAQALSDLSPQTGQQRDTPEMDISSTIGHKNLDPAQSLDSKNATDQ